MKLIVLASKSPRRKWILEQYGVKPLIIEPNTVEKKLDDPYETVKLNARNKALSVLYIAPRNSVIISADTVIYEPTLGVIGKPKTLVEAEEILWSLRGRWHTVITGVFIIDRDNLSYTVFTEETRVKMRNYSREELRLYLTSLEPLGKAGGYAIQGLGAFLVETIVGDYYNVVGLPITRLYLELKRFGVDLLELSVRKSVVEETSRTRRSIPY